MKVKFLVAAAALAMAAQPAMAARFSFDFSTLASNGDLMSGSGILDTEDYGQGYYRVTGGSGTFSMWEQDGPRTLSSVTGGYGVQTGEPQPALLYRSSFGWMTSWIEFNTVGEQDQTFSFVEGVDGRYAFSVTEVGANNVALNIRRLDSAVPEPATWALMLVGFGAVGAAMRRNRRVGATVSFAA